MIVFPVFAIALLVNRRGTHRWLVEHGWVGDFPGLGSRVMSYAAFFFIPPCAEAALLERFLGWLFGKLEPANPPTRV